MKGWISILYTRVSLAKTALFTLSILVTVLGIMSFTIPQQIVKKTVITTDTVLNKPASTKQQLQELLLPVVQESTNIRFLLHPQMENFVKVYHQKEKAEFEALKIKGKKYFTLYDDILTAYNLPKELKYLSVIESHLNANLVSSAGAVGPWQLMIYEAKRFGLKTGRVDERKNFTKSTHVAAKLLLELHGRFNDWLLVIAAYNGGEGRVKRAIAKAGSNSFWDIQYYLPAETRNHVKKFIATHYYFEGKGGYTTLTAQETTLAKARASQVESTDTLVVKPSVTTK
jgi:hypothetical protein